MSLPQIIAPPSAGEFLIEGQSIEEDSVFARVQFGPGHSRQRRAWTVNERIVTVSWFVEAAELAEIEEWYEELLLAGTREFAAKVRNQGVGYRWWTARWVEFSTQMYDANAGLVRGAVFLSGDPSAVGPDLGTLAMEIRVPLLGAASPTIPIVLSMAFDVPLDSQYFGSP